MYEYYCEGELTMVKVSIFYPNVDGKKFNMSYYCDVHMVKVQALMGDSIKSVSVEEGISGIEPGSSPVYVAMANICFDTLDEFYAAFVPALEEISSDIPNFTEIEPILQISEVKIQ